MPYWDERFAEMKKQYPGIRADQYHVDGLTIQMVLNPDPLDTRDGTSKKASRRYPAGDQNSAIG